MIVQRNRKVEQNVIGSETPVEGEEEAEKRTLSFSGRGWRTLPAMMTFAHVVTLELDDNRLTELPASLVTSLPILERLDAARNRLVVLPENIGDWSRLKEISVPFNRITFLPLSISKLSHLEYLNMQSNPLSPSLLALFNVHPMKWTVVTSRQFARNIYFVTVQIQLALIESKRRLLESVENPKRPISALKKSIPVSKSTERKSTASTAPTSKPVPETKESKYRCSPEAIPRRRGSALQLPETPFVDHRPPSPTVHDKEDLFSKLGESHSVAGNGKGSHDPMPVYSAAGWSTGSAEIEAAAALAISSAGTTNNGPNPRISDADARTGNGGSADRAGSSWNRTPPCSFSEVVSRSGKYGVYISCLFLLLVILCAIFVDHGIMDKFLGKPWVDTVLPRWFKTFFASCHDAAIEQFSKLSSRFPIYQTPPGIFGKILNFVKLIWDTLTGWMH